MRMLTGRAIAYMDVKERLYFGWVLRMKGQMSLDEYSRKMKK